MRCPWDPGSKPRHWVETGIERMRRPTVAQNVVHPSPAREENARFMIVALIHGKLRVGGSRWDALPSHLFERVGELDEPRLAAGAASEADPKR